MAAWLETTVALLALGLGACRADAAPTYEPLAEPGLAERPVVPARQSLTLLDLYGRPVQPLELSSGAVVFLLIGADCPVSNRYAPEVQRLMREYGAHVDFWLVYPGPNVTPDEVNAHVRAHGFDSRVVRDVTLDLVDRVGAEVTPEVAVFGADGVLVYSGRIDDRYVAFGEVRPEATVHDLERVLLAMMAGDEVPTTRTRAVGCPIPGLP